MPLCSLPYTQRGATFVYTVLRPVSAERVKVITFNVIITKVPNYLVVFGS
jgi:hypothetical protein